MRTDTWRYLRNKIGPKGEVGKSEGRGKGVTA